MASVGASSAEAGGQCSSTEASSTSFVYQHPSTNYSVELTVTKGGVLRCPGCGDPKKQLVRHLKSDKSCKKRCEEIDLVSFDQQLKAFRNRERVKASRHQSRSDDLEGFLLKQRSQKQTSSERQKVRKVIEATHNCYKQTDDIKTQTNSFTRAFMTHLSHMKGKQRHN